MLEESNRKKTQRRKGRKAVRYLPLSFSTHTYFKHKLLNVIMQRKTKERGKVPRANVSEYSQEGRNSKEEECFFRCEPTYSKITAARTCVQVRKSLKHPQAKKKNKNETETKLKHTGQSALKPEEKIYLFEKTRVSEVTK